MKLFLIISAIVLASLQAKAAAGDDYVILPRYGDFMTAEIKPGSTALGWDYRKLWPPVTNSTNPQEIERVIASVTSKVVTNVTSSDNHSGCSICDGIWRHGYAVYHECSIKGPYVPATERWTTWTVTTDRQITLYVPGVKEALTFWHSTPVTNWTVRETVKSEWVPVPEPPPQPRDGITNFMTVQSTNELDIAGGGSMSISEGRYSVVNTNLLRDLEAMIERIMNAKITNQGSAK